MLDFWTKLINEASVFNTLEITAVVSALIYVALATKGNRWCFLFGLISSAIYVYITYQLNFFFDVGINCYYIIMSFYGWFAWSNNSNNAKLQVKKTPKRLLPIFALSGISLTLIFAFGAERFSTAELAYLDAFTTVFAIIATYMVIKKYIENWLIWIVVDLVASGMYFYKELYFTSFLFLIYTLIAIFGYFKWKKLIVNS